MSNQSRSIFTVARTVVLNLAGMFPLFLCGVGLRDTSVSAQEKAAQPRFKNLQVLKDVPPDQLIPAMQFISASLGVECEFCHVRDAFDKDDKRSKQTARRMIQMMFGLDRDQFHGERAVTCYRGSVKPVSTLMVDSTAAYVSEARSAADPVGFDFLTSEWPDLPDIANADNYLRESALANDPPSKTFYDPEGDGIRCRSLGVHEHWNNGTDKKYSRNLGRAHGIDLFLV